MTDDELKKLEDEAKSIVGWLFFLRCVFAWVPLGLYQLYLGKPFTVAQMIAYVVLIPSILYVYDRLFVK